VDIDDEAAQVSFRTEFDLTVLGGKPAQRFTARSRPVSKNLRRCCR